MVSTAILVPTCSAWACICSISQGPWIASAKPGKFSTSVVIDSCPPGCKPWIRRGFRLARAA